MNQINTIHLLSLDKEKVKITLHELKKPLLVLFFNIKCLGCTGRAIPLAYDFMKEFSNIDVIAIHSNFSEEEVSKQDILNIFITQTLPFPIYFDHGKKLFEQYKCEGTPHWILFNTLGALIKSFFGSQEAAENRLYYALTELKETGL